MRRIAIVLVAIAAASIAVGAAFAAQSPKTRLAAMRRAVASAHSVHYVSVGSGSGHRIRMVCDVGAGRGIQRITVTIHGTSGPATVIVVKDTAYIRGNEFTLHKYFEFPKAQASRYAGKWIKQTSTSPGYATVAADATFESFRSTFAYPQHQLEGFTSGKLNGVRGTVQQRGIVELLTLVAPAHGKPFPAKEYATSPNHPGSGSLSFSHWNEPVHITAPRHAVPIAKVFGG